MENKERQQLINQFKIISNTSKCEMEIEEYKLRANLLEDRMDRFYKQKFEYLTEKDSQNMVKATNFLDDILSMYEYIRIFLINNQIKNNSLYNNILTIKIDGNEMSLLPANEIDYYHNEGRYSSIKIDRSGINCYQKHKKNLDLYNNWGGHTKLSINNISKINF